MASDSVNIPTLFSAVNVEELYNPSLQNILPPSPQATALARYGEVPVSHATGVLDITIPIYDYYNDRSYDNTN